MVYVYQEFPKWKYHPEKGGKIVQNSEEERALGEGWFNTPKFPPPPKPSQVPLFLESKVKPWWTRWGWIVIALGAIFGTIGAAIKLLH